PLAYLHSTYLHDALPILHVIHKIFIPLVEVFRRVEEAGGHLLLGHTVHEQRYPALQATGIRHAVKDGEIEVRNLIGKVLLRNAEDRKSTRLNSSHQIISY